MFQQKLRQSTKWVINWKKKKECKLFQLLNSFSNFSSKNVKHLLVPASYIWGSAAFLCLLCMTINKSLNYGPNKQPEDVRLDFIVKIISRLIKNENDYQLQYYSLQVLYILSSIIISTKLSWRANVSIFMKTNKPKKKYFSHLNIGALVLGQRDANCSLPSLHLLFCLGHLLLGAAVLQEHSGEVTQAWTLWEGEAQHALQDGRICDLRAWRGLCEVHECGDGWQDGLLPLTWQTVCDQADPTALQDDVSTFRVHTQVTQPPWEHDRG